MSASQTRRFKPTLDALETREVPAVFTVNTSSDAIAPNSVLSLREAISLNTGALTFNQLSAAEKALVSGTIGSNDHIQFSTSAIIDLTADLPTLTKQLTIDGPGAGDLVINGGSLYRPFNVAGTGNVTVSGMRVFNAHNATTGGAALNNGTLTFSRVVFDGNTAGTHGGAIENNGTLVVDQSYFHDNVATKVGGAIDNNATATITNSTLEDNTAGNTGGAIWSSGPLTLVADTVVDNHAVNAGGGLRITNNAVKIASCTITGNEADSDGVGGETGGGLSIDGGTVTLNNTVVAQNVRNKKTAKSDIAGQASGLFNFVGVSTGLSGITDSLVGNRVGTDAAPLDPGLKALAFNGGFTPTRLPAPGSPLIGKGAPLVLAGSTDQRGVARPAVSATIGSVEVGIPQSPPQQPPQSKQSVPAIVVGAGAGALPIVRVYNADGSERFSFFAFPIFYQGGVRVATGDVNGDGTDDIVVGTATGFSFVEVFDGATGGLFSAFFAFPGFAGGVSVAAGDVNGDGFADVAVGTATGAAFVGLFDGRTAGALGGFFAFPGFTGGINVAAGDVNGDGFADVAVGTASGPGAVATIDPRTGGFLNFFPLPVVGGVNVALGDLTGDGRADLILGAGGGPTPFVAAIDGATGGLLGTMLGFPPGATTGVRVAADDLTGDGRADLILGVGSGTRVRVLRGGDFAPLEDFFALGPVALPGGVYVG